MTKLIKPNVIKVEMMRRRTPVLLQVYLPSGLFVIVSWISFLIPMDVIPGRMALLVTLFLVLVNIFNTVTTNTPKVRSLPYFFTKCPEPRRRA